MSFPKLPDELRENYSLLDALVQHLKSDEVRSLFIRLKALKTAALRRSLDWRASGPHYAQNCEMCKGSNKTHFCVDPYCESEDELSLDDCLHFTPHELEIYGDIHRAYLSLILEVNELVKTGASPTDLMNIGKPKKMHQVN